VHLTHRKKPDLLIVWHAAGTSMQPPALGLFSNHLQAPDAALIAECGGVESVAATALSDLLEPAVAAAMRPYEAVAVPDSEAIETQVEDMTARFRCVTGGTDD
jgi:hypothetical protein